MTSNEMFVRTDDTLRAITPLGVFVFLTQEGRDGHRFAVTSQRIDDSTERIVVSGFALDKAFAVATSGRFIQFEASDGSYQWDELALSAVGPFHPDSGWNSDDALLLEWVDFDYSALKRAKSAIAQNATLEIVSVDADPTAVLPTVTFVVRVNGAR